MKDLFSYNQNKDIIWFMKDLYSNTELKQWLVPRAKTSNHNHNQLQQMHNIMVFERPSLINSIKAET